MPSSREDAKRRHRYRPISNGSFVVQLMILTVLLVLVIGELSIELENGDVLDLRLRAQEQAYEESQRVRSQLEAIAGDTALLAEAGNVNAVRIRQLLSQQGINISPPAE